jgi:hypothetical protein
MTGSLVKEIITIANIVDKFREVKVIILGYESR